MITGFLREHTEFTQETFRQEVTRLISPFNTLENIEAEGSGSDILQYLLSECGDLDRLPSRITFLIERSPVCIVHNCGAKWVIWFAVELKKTVKGSKRYVIRCWEMLGAGYILNDYGVPLQVDDILTAGPKQNKHSQAEIKEALQKISDKGKRYTVAELREILQVSRSTLHDNWIKKGLIKVYKEGDTTTSPYYVSQYYLDEFIQQQNWKNLEKQQPLKYIQPGK